VREECTGFRRCDNVFFCCVRPLGTPTQTLQTISEDVESTIGSRRRELQCIQATVFQSSPNDNSAFIDFSSPSFLGIPNPMEFEIGDSEWEVS
jgi:hypothetical protein